MQQFLKDIFLTQRLSWGAVTKKILWNYRPSTFWPMANVKGSLMIMQVGQQELMIPRANLWEGPITWAIDRDQARFCYLYDGPINTLRLQFSGAALHRPPKCYRTIETWRHLSEGDRRRGHVQDEAVAVFAGSRHTDGVGAQRALKRAGSQRWSVRERSVRTQHNDAGRQDLPVYHGWEPPVGRCWWRTYPEGGQVMAHVMRHSWSTIVTHFRTGIVKDQHSYNHVFLQSQHCIVPGDPIMVGT